MRRFLGRYWYKLKDAIKDLINKNNNVVKNETIKILHYISVLDGKNWTIHHFEINIYLPFLNVKRQLHITVNNLLKTRIVLSS